MTPQKQQLLTHVSKHPGLSTQEIAEDLRMDLFTAHSALNELRREGAVVIGKSHRPAFWYPAEPEGAA